MAQIVVRFNIDSKKHIYDDIVIECNYAKKEDAEKIINFMHHRLLCNHKNDYAWIKYQIDKYNEIIYTNWYYTK